MDTVQHNRIADFLWSIADDVLPMVVRRLDSMLEPTKDAILKPKTLRILADVEPRSGRH